MFAFFAELKGAVLRSRLEHRSKLAYARISDQLQADL